MKWLSLLLLLFTVLSSCVGHQGPHGRTVMLRQLDSINTLNRTSQPFAVNDVKVYVDYFDRYGTANDRLLAHYLLGRAYYENHEAPMALQCYQNAIDCADTTAADCDYYLLSRVYSQMGVIFHEQLLPKQRESFVKASRYALRAGNRLSSIKDYEQLCNFYITSNQPDSALSILEAAAALYAHYGYSQNAAVAYGRAATILIELAKLDKVGDYLSIYEKESGLFDKEGNIESGREVYYYYKGEYYLKTHHLDSAEYYFRKELHDGCDFNNQTAASRGLAMLYELRHQPDSAAKYYKYSYSMNDSLYALTAIEEVERMTALYDYTRYQEVAVRKTKEASLEKSHRQTVVFCLVVVVLCSILIVSSVYRKKKDSDLRFMRSLEELERTQSDLMQLRLQESDHSRLITRKEKEMEHLKKQIKQHLRNDSFDKAKMERNLRATDTYRRLEALALRGQPPSEEEWSRIHMLVIEHLPAFNDFLVSNQYQLNLKEHDTCLLLRLHFKPSQISMMLEVTPPYITKICTAMMQRLFSEKGTAKDFAVKLENIF